MGGLRRRVELYADRERQLSGSDPDGRNLVISCGTALHHAQVAADALGWALEVDRHPAPDQPDLLARLTLSLARPSVDASELPRIPRRPVDEVLELA